MKDIIDHLHQFISGGMGKGVGVFLAVWVIGKLSTSAAYRKVRAAIGKSCEAAGVFVDATLGSKLGRPIWNPIEKVLTDTLGFAFEQFCSGLRKNDVGALAAQHERLADVGSVDRVAMIAKKIEDAIQEGAEIPKDATTTAIMDSLKAAADEKMNEAG